MNSLMTYLFESGICVAIFYSIYWIFLKKETYFVLNRFYLLTAAGISLAIPLIPLPGLIKKTYIPEISPSLLEFDYTVSSPSVGTGEILLGIYILGAGFFFLLFIWRLFNLLLTVRKSDVRKFGKLRIVRLKNCSESFSFFKFLFLDDGISENDIHRIMDHEAIHMRQHHSLDIILLELFTILHWFNPFVRPYKKSLKEIHEYLADRAVIAQGCSLTRYKLLIVEQHVGGKLFEYASNFKTSQVKRRLNMLTRKESKGWSRLKPILAVPVALALIWVFADAKPVSFESRMEAADNALSPALIDGGQEKEEAKKEATDEKKKEKEILLKLIQKIEQEMIELKKIYKETDDPEKQKAIKEKFAELEKKAEALKNPNEPLMIKVSEGDKIHVIKVSDYIKKLKMKYEETDDPKLKKEIEHKIQELKMKQMQFKKQKEEEAKKKAEQEEKREKK